MVSRYLLWWTIVATSRAFEPSTSRTFGQVWNRIRRRRRQEPHFSSNATNDNNHPQGLKVKHNAISKDAQFSTNATNDDNHPEGLQVKHNVISEETWKIVEHWLEHDEFPEQQQQDHRPSPIPWEIGAQNRRVAQFGFRYNYDTSVVEFADDVPEIPEHLRYLLLNACEILNDSNEMKKDIVVINPSSFTQCIINVYEADDIIPWHWDHVDFGPVVLVFTFGEDRPLHLRRLKDDCRPETSLPSSQCHHEEGAHAESDYEYCTVYPRHGSCYVLSGRVRYEWEHSVPRGKGYRVSITFRTHSRDDLRDK